MAGVCVEGILDQLGNSLGESSYRKGCPETFGHGGGKGKDRPGFLEHDIVINICLVSIGDGFNGVVWMGGGYLNEQ